MYAKIIKFKKPKRLKYKDKQLIFSFALMVKMVQYVVWTSILFRCLRDFSTKVHMTALLKYIELLTNFLKGFMFPLRENVKNESKFY